MALTSPKMALRIWLNVTDAYDHGQLADNWSKVDFHDHTPGRGTLIPTEGLADASITQSKLAADVVTAFSSWKVVKANHSGTVPSGSGIGVYTVPTTAGGVGIVPRDAASNAFYIDPADYAITGRTTQFRLRGHVITNAVAPASNFTLALRPVATWGGASAVAPTVATLGVTDLLPTTAVVAPGATTTNNVVSPAATLTAGWYVITCTTSAATAAGSVVSLHSALQVRQS